MAEYIDREELLKKAWDADTRIGYVQVVDVGDILDMPAADVAPVVRCKDCGNYRYYGNTSMLVEGKIVKAGWCCRRMRDDEEHRMPADGFCSFGARRDEDYD